MDLLTESTKAPHALKKGSVFVVTDTLDSDYEKPFVVLEDPDYVIKVEDLLNPERRGALATNRVPEHLECRVVGLVENFDWYIDSLRDNAHFLRDSARLNLTLLTHGYLGVEFFEDFPDFSLFKRVKYEKTNYGIGIELGLFDPVVLGLVESPDEVPTNGLNVSYTTEKGQKFLTNMQQRFGIELDPNEVVSPFNESDVQRKDSDLFYMPDLERRSDINYNARFSYPTISGEREFFDTIPEARDCVLSLIDRVQSSTNE